MRRSPIAARVAAVRPRTRALVLAGAATGALLLACAGDPLFATAGRASLVALALAALAWRVRKAPADERPSLISVVERQSLSRDAAIALLKVRGRALLVGHGPDGVRLLADLGDQGDEGER